MRSRDEENRNNNYFVAPEIRAASDPSFGSQWHFVNPASNINITSVWDDYTGAGVKVGIVDDGVQYTHAELSRNFSQALSYDSIDGDNSPMPGASDNNHGTAVAGVIGAMAGNGQGGSGVAIDAIIAGFRMGYGAAGSLAQIEALFARQLAMDVSNNSWSFTNSFADNFNNSSFDGIEAQLQNMAVSGRSGLGTVAVFAAGNGRQDGDNVNYHNLQNSKYAISVAATDQNGVAASFSNKGAALLVSAPGVGIYTTDRTGADGYASGDYVYVDGTSFAAPMVSGVVALMLQANSGLGYRDVQKILAYSAQYNDRGGSGWQFNGANDWNGGGLHFNHNYGFGLVDANAAVRIAESWTARSTASNMVSVSGSAAPNAAIPDGGSQVSSTIGLAGGVEIERVEVSLNISHAYNSDLTVTLVSPTGVKSVLIDRPGMNPSTGAESGVGSDINFTTTTLADMGENSGGNWTLIVTDGKGGNVGTLNSWSIRAYGSGSADDAYVYTNDFGLFGADRGTINDGAGTDTLNAAAVTSNSVINIAPGATSSVAGKTILISGSSTIENASGGDGADNITGNSVNNYITGGGASDVIYGMDGNDTLIGNRGHDDLRGNNGNDAIYGGRGDDTLRGGAGDDSLFGNKGNDVLIGGAGADTLYGGDMVDKFDYNNISEAGDTIKDYTPGADNVDLHDLLISLGYGGGANAIADGYVYISANGSGTLISIDTNGLAGGVSLISLAFLENTAPGSVTVMF